MFREGLRPPNPFAPNDPLSAMTQDGVSLRTMSTLGPLLVIFPGDDVWLPEVAAQRDAIERAGTRIALVLLEDLDRDDLRYVLRVVDESGALHEHFELGTAKRLLGKPRQLPGAFLLVDGEVRNELKPRALGQRPDLVGLSRPS